MSFGASSGGITVNIRTAMLGQTNLPSSPVSCLPTVANARCPRGSERNRLLMASTWETSGDMTYLCISASDSSTQNLLAGVSRSTTVLVAYLMTVTDLSWEECLAATKVVRSYVSPNFGFQQQLQEYERTLLKEYRSWVRQEYGKNPFNDQEELRRLLTEQEEKQREQQLGSRENRWLNSPPPTYPLPYHAYGTSHNRWSNR
ncbi:dual specificity protein phosphatase 22-A-like isoform X3 [Pelodiscus sinensis]|uniref:dual specificity protein phosphatase 22-A-like isoform X3 n=1 Tax=Pelodiscus sinensis TaxID=13735 RepID=UPI003F6BBFB4